MRKRTLIPLAVLAAGLLLAELAVRVDAHHIPAPVTWSGPEEQLKYSQMQTLHREGHTGGIVVVGSSVADVGIDPAGLTTVPGVPTYNAALLGANLETVRWWTDHVVVPLLQPRQIVFGLTSREVNSNDPQASSLGQQFFASPAVRHLDGSESVWQRLERYGGDISYLFRYRKIFRDPSLLADKTTEMQIQQAQTDSRGLDLVFAHGPYLQSAAFFQATILFRFVVSPAKLSLLAATLQDIGHRGTRVVLADTPVTQDYVSLHPQAGDYAAYQNALALVAATAQVPLIRGQVWPTSLFSDPIHLNAAGTARFTPAVAAQLHQ
jgi:hypothetical protein